MRVTVAEHVYTETVEDETVLLELESGQYYGLDAVGSRLWQLLTELGSTDAVVAAAAEEFDATPAELRNDIANLVHELADRKLVVVHASADSPPARA